jgi:dihydroneopterin aldolase
MNNFDQIFIEDLKCYAKIGIFDWEKETKQPLVINITLDIKKIKKITDDINSTVDYKSLTYKINKLIEESEYQLIETLGIEIAELCLKEEKVINANIKIDKPGALRLTKNVGVIISRSKNEN